ncbi:MAG TPA: DUF1858 domain-containing protein [Clostridiaceae bacterium]|nr:DUF1858 domain-containing protein [Clostridiaceae bacterium]
MKKVLDLSKSVYELIKENPEVADVMKNLGFDNITNPAMLNTVGRIMTIPKGAAMKKIDMGSIEKEFEVQGFEIINKE